MIFDFMAGAPSKCNWKVSHILYDAALILIHFPIHDVTIGAWCLVHGQNCQQNLSFPARVLLSKNKLVI